MVVAEPEGDDIASDAWPREDGIGSATGRVCDVGDARTPMTTRGR